MKDQTRQLNTRSKSTRDTLEQGVTLMTVKCLHHSAMV